MENKEPIKVAAYIRVGNASQLTHRAAIYARCNHEDEMALDAQMNKLREYAKQNNYEVVSEYKDFGCGGPSDRQGMTSLIEDAMKGKIATLLVTDTDRLSRKPEEMLALAEIFDTEGVNVIPVNNPGANMHALVNMMRKLDEED